MVQLNRKNIFALAEDRTRDDSNYNYRLFNHPIVCSFVIEKPDELMSVGAMAKVSDDQLGRAVRHHRLGIFHRYLSWRMSQQIEHYLT